MTTRLPFCDPAAERDLPWRPPFPHELVEGARHCSIERIVAEGMPRWRWRFEVIGPGIHPDLLAMRWMMRPFEGVGLAVESFADHPLELMVALNDIRGYWSWHPAASIPPGRSEVRFPLAGFLPVDRDPLAAPPFKQMVLRIVDPPRDEMVTIDIHSVWLEPPEETAASVTIETLAPGDRSPLDARARDPRDSCYLVTEAGSARVAAFGDPEDEDGLVGFEIPRGLGSGDYRLELWQAGRRVATTSPWHLESRPMPPARPLESSRSEAPFVAGYVTYNPKAPMLRRFARAGADLVSVTTTIDQHVFDLAPPVGESGDEAADFAGLDALVVSLLQAVPDARLLLRVYLGAPAGWEEEHPEEAARADDGQGRVEPLRMVFVDSRQRRAVPSLHSRRLRRRWLRLWERFLRHVRGRPWGSRVVAVVPCSGGSEEWFHWYDEERPDLWGDLSEAAADAYRRWAARHGLPERAIPSRVRRERAAYEFFRDPQREADVIDYFRFCSESLVEIITELAAKAKEIAPSWQVGVFYGYCGVFTGANRHLNGGHLALARLLESEDIDFLCAPTGYGHREAGSGFSYSMLPAGSARLHGKAVVIENDLRTHRVRVPPGTTDIDALARAWGFTPRAEDAIAIQRRETARALAEGASWWWLDLYPYGLYDDARLLGEFGMQIDLARRGHGGASGSRAEIAVFIDEHSILHETPEGTVHWHAVESAWEGLARMGAPYEVFLLSDLERIDGMKLAIVLDAWACREPARRAIARSLAAGDLSLLFIGPAGLYRGERLDVTGPRDLHGLDVEVALEERIKVRTHTDGAPAGFGPETMPPPWIRLRAAPGDLVEGTDEDGNPTWVTRPLPGGRFVSVLSAPAPPAAVLRELARRSGVHVWLESDDQLLAGPRTLGVHARDAGSKTIRLPAPARLRDPFGGSDLERAEVHHVSMMAGETRLWLME